MSKCATEFPIVIANSLYFLWEKHLNIQSSNSFSDSELSKTNFVSVYELACGRWLPLWRELLLSEDGGGRALQNCGNNPLDSVMP
jgi:hypothetical protein